MKRKSNQNEILWIKQDTKKRMYGLKGEYPKETFDGILNHLIDDFDTREKRARQEKKDGFWGKY